MPRSGALSCAPGAAASSGITLRRDSGLGPAAPLRGALTAPTIGGMPPKPPGPAAPTCGKPSRPAAGNAVAASRIAGDAVAHDGGTDNPPTVAAPPSPADTPGPYERDRAAPSAAGAAAAGTAAAAGAAADDNPFAVATEINGMTLKKSPAVASPTPP